MLFPELPDVTAASDEELQAHIDASLAAIDAVIDGSADLADLNDDQVLEAAEAATASIQAARGELARREEAATATSDRLAALRGQAAGEPEIEDEPEAVEAVEEPVVEDEPVEEPAAELEPVAAAAPPTRTLRRAAPAASADHQPRMRIRDRDQSPTGGVATITAASEGLGQPLGSAFGSLNDVAEAMVTKLDQFAAGVPQGVYDNVPVAKIRAGYSNDRILDDREALTWSKIQAVAGEKAEGLNMDGQPALIASGGLCAPVTPYYDLMLVSETMRPVRDALPGFQAVRGGIRFMTPPVLSAITTAIGRITASQDGAGGTNATKSCQTIACPSQVEVDVAILYHCLRFGNLGSRAWPEQIEQAVGLTMAAWARLAETALLDAMAAASTAVTGAAIAGANSTLLPQIIEAAAAQRNRHRMDPRRVLRVVMPAWAIDLLVADVIRSQFGRFEASIDGVIAYLRSLNIAVSFYVDSPTGAGQVFGAQGAGALLAFPTTVVWFIFPEGSFLYLDGGTLDLGVVRDSTLNNTNDYTIFGEGFENLAFIGVESLKVTTTLCASGATTAPVSVTCPIAA